MIERSPVHEDLIDFALNAGNDFLEGGNFFGNIGHIRSVIPLAASPSEARIMFIKDEHRDYFAPDYELPTPGSTTSDSPDLTRLSLLHLSIGASHGVPFVPDYPIVMQDVYPDNDYVDTKNVTLGSEEDFAFHTDQAYRSEEEIPDTIVLACIRNLEQAVTRVGNLTIALSQLDEATIETLATIDAYFRTQPHRPILTRAFDSYRIRLQSQPVIYDEELFVAERKLRDVLDETAVDVCLQPGEILVFPNHTAPHARKAFKRRYVADERRWLQRVMVRSAA